MNSKKEMLSPLVTTSSSRLTERRKRKDHYSRETVVHSAVDEYISEGWELDRKLKYRSKIKRVKSADENFENRVWMLFDKLGFDELNQGRKFKVTFDRESGQSGEKQIDVFAKDDETVVVVECKTATEIKKKSLQKDIEEFSNLKGKIANSIRRHYGANFKPKIIWMIATSNIIWSDADLNRAVGERINVVTERELRYFLELAGHLGAAGKYQFLAHFLEGQKIPALENVKVPAIKGKLGGNQFYAFVATPLQLLRVAFVNHRTLNDPQGAPSYQRLINKSRLKSIGAFLENGGFFPTNIILNLSKRPRFDTKQRSDEVGVQFGDLYLPDTYKSAWVIDGQHRLYGFAELAEKRAKESVFVLAFEELTKEKEANLFVEINHEQKSVPKTLLDDLKGELHWASDDPRQRIGAMCSRLINVLNQDLGEPFYERVVQTGLKANKENKQMCLTLPQLVQGLDRSRLLGSVHPKLKTYSPGPFTGRDDFETLDRARGVLNAIFSLLRDANPSHWDEGPDAGVCRNISVQALFLIIAEAIEKYSSDAKLDPIQMSPLLIAQEITSYLQPIIDFIKVKSRHEVRSLFRDGVPPGSSGPRELFLKLVDLCRSAHPDFGPKDFDAWKQAQDKERSTQIKEMIGDLNREICGSLFGILRAHYGDEDYFEAAVNNPEVFLAATKRMLDEPKDSRGSLEEYLDLIQYKKVAERKEHWPLVEEIFNIPLRGEKGIAKNLKWLDQLNDIRKRVAHETQGRGLDLEQMEFVEWIHEEFMNKLGDHQARKKNP